MEIGSIKRWQWIVISILIGLLIGYVRNAIYEDPIGDFRYNIKREEFEPNCVTKYTVVGGDQKFNFHDLTVELLPDTRDAAQKPVKEVNRDGKFATLLVTDHGYVNGQKVRVSGSSYPQYNGEFTISNVTANGFRIEVGEKAPNKPGNLVVTTPQRLIYVIKGKKRAFQPLELIKKNDRAVKKFVKEGRTATITLPGHGYANGQVVVLACGVASKTHQFTNYYVVREATADTFRVNVPADLPDQPDGELRTYIQTPVYSPLLSHVLLDCAPYKSGRLPGPLVTYKPSATQRLFEKLHIKQPDPPGSVLDYLATLQAATGNKFEYRWWTQPNVRIAVWTAGSFVFFGLIFPTLVNIMAFGTVFRPKEEKGDSLRNIKTGADKAVAPQSKVTAEDWDQLKALEAELEKKLAGNTVTDAAATPPEDFEMQMEKAPAKLSDKATEPAAVLQTQEQHEFARKTGDFYPVERGHSAKDKDTDHAKAPEKKPADHRD
ncbi:MAG: hypothetical protein ACHRHE_21155 [Tepidisphaerales bacterium]